MALACVFAALAAPASTGALASDAPERFAEAIRLARARAPWLARERATIDERAAEARAAGSGFAPYVEVQREGLSADLDDEANAQTIARFGSTFLMPGTARRARDLDAAATEYANAAHGRAALELGADVARAWVDLAAREDERAIYEQQRARIDRAVAIAEARLAVGEIPGTELVQLQLEQARLAALVARQDGERAERVAALIARAGGEVPRPRSGDLREIAAANGGTVPSLAELLGMAEAGPAGRALRGGVALEASASEIARRTRYGLPEGELEWEHVPSIGGADSFDAFGFRIAVPLPFGAKGREEGARAAARARAAESMRAHELAQLEASIEGDLVRLDAARERLAAIGRIAGRLPLTERALAEQYRLGAISYVEYIDGLNRLDGVLLEEIAAHHDALAARVGLWSATGSAELLPVTARLEERAP